MGGKINNSVNNGKGFSLNGENRHRIGSRFVQLYVFNIEIEIKNMIGSVWIELIFAEIKNWNWKHYSKIIFKCMNSTMGPLLIFFNVWTVYTQYVNSAYTVREP